MKKYFLIACCFIAGTAFAQQSKNGNGPTIADVINCLRAADLNCTIYSPTVPPNPVLLRGAVAPSQNASDFVSYFSNSFSIMSAASVTDASQAVALAQKKLPYKNLNMFIKANPNSPAANNLQQILNTSTDYDAFQSSLAQYYSTLTNAADKEFIYGVSNSMDIVSVPARAGRTAAASPSCSGWWSCWGKCAASILGGALGSGLSGGISGSVVPGIGTAAGAIVGGIAGAISGAVAGCN